MPLILAYNDVDAAAHQAHVTTLSGQRHHPISVCVYGDPSSPLYAAVWAQEPAPVWIAVHGQTTTQSQSWIKGTVQAQGFSLKLVSAVGSGSNVVFAGVEKSGIHWDAKHDLAANDLQTFLHAR